MAAIERPLEYTFQEYQSCDLLFIEEASRATVEALEGALPHHKVSVFLNREFSGFFAYENELGEDGGKKMLLRVIALVPDSGSTGEFACALFQEVKRRATLAKAHGVSFLVSGGAVLLFCQKMEYGGMVGDKFLFLRDFFPFPKNDLPPSKSAYKRPRLQAPISPFVAHFLREMCL